MENIRTYDIASGAQGEKPCGLELGGQVLYRTMKDAVVQYQSNRRQGDAHTKIRSDIAGHIRKPWKQKKTGRARSGDVKNPLWRGGATVFGPRNKRNWTYHLPRKQRLVALRSALLGKLGDGQVHELAGLEMDAPSAKKARGILGGLGTGRDSVLLLLREADDTVWKSFRNFPRVSVRLAADATAYDLLAHKWLLLQEGALEVLGARFARLSTPVATSEADA